MNQSRYSFLDKETTETNMFQIGFRTYHNIISRKTLNQSKLNKIEGQYVDMMNECVPYINNFFEYYTRNKVMDGKKYDDMTNCIKKFYDKSDV